VTPQFGASLTDDSRVIIYDRNMFIVQATAYFAPALVTMEKKVLTTSPDVQRGGGACQRAALVCNQIIKLFFLFLVRNVQMEA